MDSSSIDVRAHGIATPRPSRLWWTLLVASCAIALIPLSIPVVAPHDARLLMYPYGATLDLLPAIFCILLARRTSGQVRLQWLLLTVQFILRSISLWVPTIHLATAWLSPRVAAWLINGFGSASFLFCLLPLTAFADNASRRKRALDSFMTLLLCGLNFLTAFSTGPSGFSNLHLQVSFFTVVFLLLAAETVRRTATTAAEQDFNALLTIYLATRVVMLFFVNIVGALWLQTTHELPFDVLFGAPQLCFSVFALRALESARRPRKLRPPHALLGSLLPSMVLFASVMLALHAYPEYPLVCSVSISLSVICFILRTHMLYQRMLREQGMLIARTGQLEDLATHDALTGIGNRRWLEQKAFEHLESAPGAGDAALLLIDADEFKWINDTFGHRAGDELLLAMSAVLREQVRNFHGACCARIGGDEFVALLPHVSAEAAMPLAEQIRQRIARLPSDFGDCHASVSIGVAVTSGPVPLASLLELADEALYRAKGRGRNLVELAVEDCVAFAQSSRHSEHRRFRD